MRAPEGLQGPAKCQNGCTSITPLARERGCTQKGAPLGSIGRLPLEPPRAFSIFPEPCGTIIALSSFDPWFREMCRVPSVRYLLLFENSLLVF